MGGTFRTRSIRNGIQKVALIVIINRINKLEDYRIYRNFRWREIPDFGKYNLIYGLNGAGKTSLSTLFRFLQTRTVPDVGDVEFVIDGKLVNGKNFRSSRVSAWRLSA
ncbi:AAA family ATPase [Cupriavidus pauculus]|uniref:AAA family ATPase n=1 Tax=Cupriavidus pauculus TaxID=82633 RepID=UPI001FD5E2BB|nr:AAA family ATPase [Cupriavidus pauculus]